MFFLHDDWAFLFSYHADSDIVSTFPVPIDSSWNSYVIPDAGDRILTLHPIPR
jgi:hypothetical protein